MNRKICVGNLPSSVTQADLKEKFEQFGRVISVAIHADRKSGRGKGSGLVEMANGLDAQTAINRLNMTQYDDVVISVYNILPEAERVESLKTRSGGQQLT